MELSSCPRCGMPAEIISTTAGGQEHPDGDLVGIRCIQRHWSLSPRSALVA